jgi:hypothetical protein
MKCKNDLSDCTCNDLTERLLKVSGDVFVFKMCVKCQKHYAQCKCEVPEWKVVGGPKHEA